MYLFQDPTNALKRRKAGGNRKKSYTEGWVEFADKRIAKRVAISLNNTNIGTSLLSHIETKF